MTSHEAHVVLLHRIACSLEDLALHVGVMSEWGVMMQPPRRELEHGEVLTKLEGYVRQLLGRHVGDDQVAGRDACEAILRRIDRLSNPSPENVAPDDD